MTVRDVTRRLRVHWTDVLLAAGVTVAELVGTQVLAQANPTDRQLDLLGAALLVTNSVPLLVRDVYPRPVLLIVSGAACAYMLLGYPGGFFTIGVVLAIWAAVAAGDRLAAALAAGGLVLAALLATVYVHAGHFRDADAPFWLAGWLVASFVLGEVSRSRREYIEQVEQRAIEAERTREEEARRRASEERVRIARELHDVLAHHISVINVQAGVAVHLLDKQPDQARTALTAISEASKDALRELRATLGVLRRVDEAEPRAPVPGLSELDDLVASASAAGLSVSVDTKGDARPLPSGPDFAAYRIIQEALTNVKRHARASRVWISIRHRARDVEITVEDDGTAALGPDPIRPGNGLTGMHERATAVGGTLEAGPRAEGGFRVMARLPVGETH
jgi:signal transduction histidine kinase